MAPKISIITVCYNSVHTLYKTMQSVFEQNYEQTEYIIIDGASTDGTQELVKKFVHDTGFVITFISEKDTGIYDAMNKGLKLATGDLICMINSDDWLEAGALNIIAKEYAGKDYCVFYGMERRLKNGMEESVGFHSHNFLTDGNIPHQTCYVPKKCYEEFGNYNISYKSAADYEFMLRLYYSNKVEFRPIYRILANFTTGGTSAGAIGYLEEAEIKRKYNIVSKKKYYYLVTRARFLKLIGQLR